MESDSELMKSQTHLSRTLSPLNVWALALGAIIGWGCFILPGNYLSWSGPLGSLLGMAIGGVLMMFIARAYGFLMNKFPVSGGAFAFSYAGFGRNHSFACGWFLVLTYLSIVPLNATALPIPVNFFAGDILQVGHLYTIAGWPVYLGEVALACATLLFFGIMNVRGVGFAGGSQLWMVVLMVGAVIMLAIASLMDSNSSIQNLLPAFAPEKPIWVSIVLVLALTPWAYMGFDTVPQAAEEMGFPANKAKRLMYAAIIIGGILYCVVILATALPKPWTEQVYPKVPDWATGASIRNSMGNLGVGILMVGIVMGIFTGINGFYLATSRLLFSMGRARILPPWFSEIHPQYKTPRNAILFITLLSLLAPWFGREALLWIVNMSALGMALGYGYTSFAAARLSQGTEEYKYRGIFYVGGIFSVCVLLLLMVPQSPASLTIPSWIALGVWVILGCVFYRWQAREFRSIPREDLDRLILGQ
jgi:amino acid transporter